VVRRAAYAGAIYHLTNRGDRREPIFRDDLDRRTFLRTLHEHVACWNPSRCARVPKPPLPLCINLASDRGSATRSAGVGETRLMVAGQLCKQRVTSHELPNPVPSRTGLRSAR
jgi:hypothetical protein